MGAARDRRFDSMVAAWLATLASANTREAYRRDLEVYGAWLAVAALRAVEVTPAGIEAFRLHCEAAGSPAATVNRRMSAVSSFYRHAAPRWRSTDPTEGAARSVSDERPPTAHLSAAQARAVWTSATRLGDKTAVVVGLVLLDGMKTKDLLLLDVEDLAGLRLHPRTSAAIRSHLAGRSAGPLLQGDNPTRESARLTRFGVDYLVKRAGVGAGLSVPLTVNTLRATQRVMSVR